MLCHVEHTCKGFARRYRHVMPESASHSVTQAKKPKPFIDWPAIEDLIRKGVTSVDIAKQFPVTDANVRQYARRHGLNSQRDAVKAVVALKVSLHQKQADANLKAVTENSLRSVLHALNREVATSKPFKRKTTSLNAAEQKARIIHTVTQSTKLIEGWADTTAQVVDVELIRGLQDAQLQPCIDVPSSTLPSEQPALLAASTSSTDQPDNAPADVAQSPDVPTQVSTEQQG